MAGRRLEAPHHVERRQATQGVDRIRMILVHATNEDSAFVPAIVLPEHFTRRAEARKARLHRNASSSMNLAHTKENNMILRPPYGPVFLMPGQAIRLPGVGPLTLRVRSGSVWMTQAGRPEDLILDADDSRCVGPDADVVVSAFKPARLDLLEAKGGCAEEPAARRDSRLPGQPAAA